MTKPITKDQLKKLHTLLSVTKQTAYKQDLMDTFCSDGRYPTSSKDLYFSEADAIIKHLEQMQAPRPPQPPKKADTFLERSKNLQRRSLISCLREVGYNRGAHADMDAIYAWVLKYGYLHKELNEYTYEELPKLVTQAKNYRASYLQSLAKK
jgi:hypothetical protein